MRNKQLMPKKCCLMGNAEKSIIYAIGVALLLMTGAVFATDSQQSKTLPNLDPEHPRLVWRNNHDVLWRGDSHGSPAVFETGILPNTIRKSLPKQEWIYDFLSHKGDSSKSVFSSTTYEQKQAIVFTHKLGWVYEIYAPGGIDQQASIGQDRKTGESEVSFPGGIKGKFVKQACFYKDYQLQYCENNPHFVSPTWSESPGEVSVEGFNVAELKYVTPKASCVHKDITGRTPADLCLISDVAEPELRNDHAERIKKDGICIRYDVSDRTSIADERFVILIGENPSSDGSKFIGRQQIPYDAPETGTMLITPDKIAYPGDNYYLWRMGVTHNIHDDKLKEPISTLDVFVP